MTDIKDRLRWRADSVGDGFHSDLIYRDALRYIEKLEAALLEIDTIAVRHIKGGIGKAQIIARKALDAE